jgi:glycosyltransferase involved in cell wall biosynthesis
VPAARAMGFGPLVAPLGIPGQAYDPARPRSRAPTGVPEGGEGGGGGGGSSSKLIVCVCDPQSRLRAAVALRVMALLATRHPELRMALLGPGSDTEELRMHAAALGTTKLVSFLGERDDYLSVFSGADLGWVVARGDDAAFALLELQALRVPVLAERSVVTQQYVADGITGLLLPSDDVPAAAAAVARMLAQDDQRAAMGQAARARVLRDFTETVMIDGFEQAALAAAGGRGQR